MKLPYEPQIGDLNYPGISWAALTKNQFGIIVSIETKYIDRVTFYKTYFLVDKIVLELTRGELFKCNGFLISKKTKRKITK